MIVVSDTSLDVAEEHGFDAVGTLTVLEFAAERKLLDLKPALDGLRSTTFYITDVYINAALHRDAARTLAQLSNPHEG